MLLSCWLFVSGGLLFGYWWFTFGLDGAGLRSANVGCGLLFTCDLFRFDCAVANVGYSL